MNFSHLRIDPYKIISFTNASELIKSDTLLLYPIEIRNPQNTTNSSDLPINGKN